MTDEEKAHFEGMKDECVKESDVDVALFDRLKAGEAIVGDKSLDCFGACMLQKSGIVRKFNVEYVINFINYLHSELIPSRNQNKRMNLSMTDKKK